MADATEAQIGSQSTLAYWGGSPVAWTNLGPIRSITGIGVTRTEKESTTLESTGIERIGGLPDGKQVTITFTTANGNHDVIEAFVNDGDPIDLRVVIPPPLDKTRYFTIQPLDYDEGDISPDDLLEMTLMGRITGGAPTATPSHP